MKLKNPLNPSLSVVSNTQHLEIDSRIDSDSSVKFLDAVLPRRFQIATTKNTQYSLFYLRYIYIYRHALIAICTLERDENRVPSIHEHDILGLVLAERIYWLCKTVDAGTMTIKDRRDREREIGRCKLLVNLWKAGWVVISCLASRTGLSTYSASGSLGGASENLRDPCNGKCINHSISADTA